MAGTTVATKQRSQARRRLCGSEGCNVQCKRIEADCLNVILHWIGNPMDDCKPGMCMRMCLRVVQHNQVRAQSNQSKANSRPPQRSHMAKVVKAGRP